MRLVVDRSSPKSASSKQREKKNEMKKETECQNRTKFLIFHFLFSRFSSARCAIMSFVVFSMMWAVCCIFLASSLSSCLYLCVCVCKRLRMCGKNLTFMFTNSIHGTIFTTIFVRKKTLKCLCVSIGTLVHFIFIDVIRMVNREDETSLHFFFFFSHCRLLSFCVCVCYFPRWFSSIPFAILVSYTKCKMPKET